ncbi:MAG: Ig-like domain-containing protein [Bacteroidota bacterium]
MKAVFRKVFFFSFLLISVYTLPGCGQEKQQLDTGEEYIGKFTIKDARFAIWNGSAYVPFFVKGINLGISLPGTQPGHLAATREDYRRWFHLIKEAGYNTIRLYTLHYPRFYEELSQYNLDHPRNPLLVIQGIWLEENESARDLFEMTSAFNQEIREVVSAVHGDIQIDHRFGKAYGDFTTDISPWLLGFLPGREIFPGEVALSNENHGDVSDYSGAYFQLAQGDPIEVWLAGRLDSLMIYEYEHYQTVRPTGFSSWPTLDPLTHPSELDNVDSSEDLEKIDLSNLETSDSSGGFFIGYHAYPYYPDFVIHDPVYGFESDTAGPNSYLGYLKDLKAHYGNIPLVIAEFGVPTSWGSGHQTPSGMNHGGLSEEEQGRYTIRMLDNIHEAGCAGGIQFSLIDEWFKQTWITNPLSDRDYRHFWHNIASPEQNFGILSFAPPPAPFTPTGTFPDQVIKQIKVHSDYTFFRIRIQMDTEKFLDDTLWIALDTYDETLGESLLPDGSSIAVGSDTLRAEFSLQIPLGGDRADLFVIPSYDVYGIKALNRLDTVVSKTSDSGQWNPVRWLTSYHYNVTQYIGRLSISNSEDPYQFLNAVTVFIDSLEIRIPWTLINYPAPTVSRAMHYVSHLEGNDLHIDQRDTLTDGIALTVSLNDQLFPTERYTWSPWDYEKIVNDPPTERKKQSFHYLKKMLPLFNTPPIAYADTFEVWPGNPLDVGAGEGLLANDMDLDGNPLQALLPLGSSVGNGNLYLHPDGSFNYIPDPDFTGNDFFMYYLDDGAAFSSLAPVFLKVAFPSGDEQKLHDLHSSVFPNPGKERFCIKTTGSFQEASLQVVDMMGREVIHTRLKDSTNWIEIRDAVPGVYLFNVKIDQIVEQHRILIL